MSTQGTLRYLPDPTTPGGWRQVRVRSVHGGSAIVSYIRRDTKPFTVASFLLRERPPRRSDWTRLRGCEEEAA